MSPVLIIGGTSLVGRYLIKESVHLTFHINIPSLYTSNTYVYLPSKNWHNLNITSKQNVFDVFETVKPSHVIHCAAIGSVDYAEENYQEVARVNIDGLKNVIEATNRYNAHFVYLSSNAVFSGKNPPYDEKSPLNAVNKYGIIKRQAEKIVQDNLKSWLIIRPFLLYGYPYSGGRTNWVNAIINKLSVGQGFKLVDNHIWQPTYTGDLANTIWNLLDEKNEIYNVASPERATLYELGLKVCDIFGLEKKLIEPVHADYFPKLAERPYDTTYDLIKLTSKGIVLSDIRTGLEKMKAEHN